MSAPSIVTCLVADRGGVSEWTDGILDVTSINTRVEEEIGQTDGSCLPNKDLSDQSNKQKQ
jgi:hypothetical protein